MRWLWTMAKGECSGEWTVIAEWKGKVSHQLMLTLALDRSADVDPCIGQISWRLSLYVHTHVHEGAGKVRGHA